MPPGAMTDATWAAFATTVGYREFLEDERVATKETCRRNVTELDKIVDGWARESTRAALMEVFKKMRYLLRRC